MIVYLALNAGYCRPADPLLRTKPLQNIEYSGFISREFFQVVVTVDLTKDELSINDLRMSCKKDAIRKRDEQVITLLKQAILETKTQSFPATPVQMAQTQGGQQQSQTQQLPVAGMQQPAQTQGQIPASTTATQNALPANSRTRKDLLNPKNFRLSRGEFNWFLDNMVLYREDYSKSEKCTFVFRIIQKGLFEKIEKTKFSVE
ncbi:MAG: hypothetical protein K8R21_12010 [Leptospira sp.]|nr:hypothetical protein [Leptospira sp.]